MADEDRGGVVDQYVTAPEVAEIQRLLLVLNGLREIAPEGFDVHDSNGEVLGTFTCVDAGTWGFGWRTPGGA